MYCPHCGKFIEEKNKNIAGRNSEETEVQMECTRILSTIHWIHSWNGLGR